MSNRKAQRKAKMAAPPGAWQDNDLVFCQPDGRPWLPDHVSKRFKRLATEAGVPVVKLNEGGRHTGNSLMYDAEIRPDLVMRRVGHASQEMSQRYNHPERQAHLAASARVTALVSGAGKRVLSGTDVPRIFPTAAVPRTSQPGQITGFRR